VLPRFVKVFPHDYKRVLGVPRLSEQEPYPVPLSSYRPEEASCG